MICRLTIVKKLRTNVLFLIDRYQHLGGINSGEFGNLWAESGMRQKGLGRRD